ncbi:MAG: hypothetical protein OQK45_07190 [Sulfurovum sp.]|nr:hypothetical protein [Sulfurovum sp.]
MTHTVNRKHVLNGHSHISNYKKALLSIFDKKNVWNYLKEQRVTALKRKKALEKQFRLDSEVIYH